MRPESTVLVSPRADVLTETVEGFGTVRFTPVDPVADSAVLHSWVVEERAQFWGMNDASRELVQEIYEDVDRRDTHHAFMVRLDDEPVALFQTYEPTEDRVSDCYAVREGDIGVHLMLAPVTGRPGPDSAGPWSGRSSGSPSATRPSCARWPSPTPPMPRRSPC